MQHQQLHFTNRRCLEPYKAACASCGPPLPSQQSTLYWSLDRMIAHLLIVQKQLDLVRIQVQHLWVQQGLPIQGGAGRQALKIVLLVRSVLVNYEEVLQAEQRPVCSWQICLNCKACHSWQCMSIHEVLRALQVPELCNLQKSTLWTMPAVGVSAPCQARPGQPRPSLPIQAQLSVHDDQPVPGWLE